MAEEKFIHKYKLDGGMSAYVPSSEAKRPFLKLWSTDWEGKGSGGSIPTALNQLERIRFVKEEKEEKEEPVLSPGAGPKKPAVIPVKASISDKIRSVAGKLRE